MIQKILKITTNPYTWVQWCHFSIAFITFLLTYLFRGNLWIVAVLFVPAAAYKEFWIDPHDENHSNGLPSVAGQKKIVGKPDYDDFTFYMLGITAALLLLHFTHHR